MSSTPILNAADGGDIVRRVAWEVEVKQPCRADYTTDRSEVRPTGRKVGTVITVGAGGECCLKMEKWFVESESFIGRGSWRELAPPPEQGQTVFTEHADGSVSYGILH